MVRILGVATFAFAAFSTATALAHPHHQASKHHAIARRAAVAAKHGVTKSDACAARDAQKAITSTSSPTSSSAPASTSKVPDKDKDKDDDTDSSSKPTSAGLLAFLPASGVQNGWTVTGLASADVKTLELDDDTFDITKSIRSLSHHVVSVDDKQAIHGKMSKGAYALNDSPPGGFSFYTSGPKSANLDLTKAREVSFGYSVKFSNGYDFVKGGKLPGLYGGVDEDTAATCSGGRHDDGCFSCRLMFRDGGDGELYLYIPPDLNRDNLCGDDGFGECRDRSSNGKAYGASIGTGKWKFKAGKWTSVRQVIHLNTPGKRDGWAKIYVNGRPDPVVHAKELSFRDSSKSVFRGLQMQYFHGGHEVSWAPDHDQDAWFSDFTVAITQYED